MAAVPSKISSRISAGLKRFQPILSASHSRDVNESDTVVLVTDVMHEILGYDKYAEITSEHAIRGTYCDLAVKLDSTLAFLVEVKAIGLDLKDSHVKQAVDYAANQGVEWVVLTNGITWRAFRIGFAKPISSELVVEFNLLTVNPRNDDDVELVFLLSKEGWQRSKISEYHSLKEALSRFSIGAIVVSDPVVEVIRRELKRLSPGVRVELDDVRSVLEGEVLKREVLDGERAALAKRLVARAAGKLLRQSRNDEEPAGASGEPLAS